MDKETIKKAKQGDADKIGQIKKNDIMVIDVAKLDE